VLPTVKKIGESYLSAKQLLNINHMICGLVFIASLVFLSNENKSWTLKTQTHIEYITRHDKGNSLIERPDQPLSLPMTNFQLASPCLPIMSITIWKLLIGSYLCLDVHPTVDCMLKIMLLQLYYLLCSMAGRYH